MGLERSRIKPVKECRVEGLRKRESQSHLTLSLKGSAAKRETRENLIGPGHSWALANHVSSQLGAYHSEAPLKSLWPSRGGRGCYTPHPLFSKLPDPSIKSLLSSTDILLWGSDLFCFQGDIYITSRDWANECALWALCLKWVLSPSKDPPVVFLRILAGVDLPPIQLYKSTSWHVMWNLCLQTVPCETSALGSAP